jgi:hypothetical protein
MKKVVILSGVILVAAFATCIRPPDYPIEPQITFKSLSKTTMRQGSLNQDSLFLTLGFTDGDGDLGTVGQSKDSLNVFLIDKRYNRDAEAFRMPFVPEAGARNGISGDIRILLFTTCCKVLPACEPSTIKPIDTLRYDIYITDRAGHKSNLVETAPILLQCR